MNQLRKSERLKNYKLKKLLFNKGCSFKNYPFKIFWYVILKEEYVYKKSSIVLASVPLDKSKAGFKQLQYDIAGNALPESAVFLFPAKAVFSASKRTINKATDRNQVKRMTKEAYRKNKKIFCSFLRKKALYCLVAFDYIGVQNPKQEDVENHLIASLQKLIKEIDLKIKEKSISKQK